jgi:glucosamine-6-phosphate deaminase
VEGALSHRCPLSCIQNHPRAVVICDEDAAGDLEAGTVNYFKALEKPILEKIAQGAQDLL